MKKKETTSVQQVDIDLDEILGMGTDSIMTPGETEKKPSIFAPMDVDTTFLDKHDDDDDNLSKEDTDLEEDNGGDGGDGGDISSGDRTTFSNDICY